MVSTEHIERRVPERGLFAAKVFLILWGALLLLLSGCACRQPFVGARPFDFHTDSFAYANQLVWEYHFDENGKWVHHRREPPADYTRHCFVVARSARQFFQNTRFDSTQPVATDAEYRRLVHRVVSIDPTHPPSEDKKVVIPGYANLRDFSAAHEALIKSECGGWWQSYVQRGHWRMILPFSRGSQEHTVERLVDDLKDNRPPVVHVVRFPQLTINHAILLFAAKETDKDIVFSVYDPNKPEGPVTLTYDRATRTFNFPGNDYWPGGRVDVYEVYWKWDY